MTTKEKFALIRDYVRFADGPNIHTKEETQSVIEELEAEHDKLLARVERTDAFLEREQGRATR